MSKDISPHLKQGDAFPKKTKGTLRLYSMQYCPYAMRARLMLAKKNVEHEVVNIHLRNKPTWFLEKYPVGTVPVIEKDDRLLGGSLVIAEFIDEVYSKPGQRLLPQDSYEKARIKMLIDDTFSKAITSIYQAIGKRENWEESFYPRVGELEKVLEANKYFGGKAIGYADYMIYPWLRLLGLHGMDNVLSAGKFPKLGQWLKEVAQDETIKKCDTKPEILSKFLNGYLTGNFVYDLEI
ncbi:glutathione S-transferase omega-1-like [Styela clava]|uniref:glutathione S-transferase omega-1-like n=1 Tax=Styela clava TaxID=7725 RepID=UPI00193AD99B|nr:glutathione S-transferase omega-1-like [Styela clava]